MAAKAQRRNGGPPGRGDALRSTWIGLLGNMLLAAVKFTAGILGHSFALIADGIESSADIASSLLVLLGIRYASKPADKNHPYGHGKAEALVTFVVVGFLIISAVLILYEAIHFIRTPHQMPAPFTLPVLGGIIIMKEILYRFVHRVGKKTGSSAVRADAWHHRSDAITSASAFIGISIGLALGEGYEAADDYAAMVAAGIILFNSYRIFRPALGEVMDEHRYPEMEQKIRRCALEVRGVKDSEKCMIRKSGMVYYADFHVVVDPGINVADGHRIAHEVQDHLLKQIPALQQVLVHIEPESVHKPGSG